VVIIEPCLRGIVINKQKPSSFFGTSLASNLTLLAATASSSSERPLRAVCGAAVVDAFSLNFRVILAEEGCFDRSEASHAVSLCDMHATLTSSRRNPLLLRSAAHRSVRSAHRPPRNLYQGSAALID
jgi:hypothetical protein